MTTALAPALQVTCTDTSCLTAWSHASLCECSCDGSGHGKGHKAHFPTTARRRDMDPFARMRAGVPDDDDADAAFGITPTGRSSRDSGWCARCFNAAVDCECEA